MMQSKCLELEERRRVDGKRIQSNYSELEVGSRVEETRMQSSCIE